MDWPAGCLRINQKTNKVVAELAGIPVGFKVKAVKSGKEHQPNGLSQTVAMDNVCLEYCIVKGQGTESERIH